MTVCDVIAQPSAVQSALASLSSLFWLHGPPPLCYGSVSPLSSAFLSDTAAGSCFSSDKATVHYRQTQLRDSPQRPRFPPLFFNAIRSDHALNGKARLQENSLSLSHDNSFIIHVS